MHIELASEVSEKYFLKWGSNLGFTLYYHRTQLLLIGWMNLQSGLERSQPQPQAWIPPDVATSLSSCDTAANDPDSTTCITACFKSIPEVAPLCDKYVSSLFLLQTTFKPSRAVQKSSGNGRIKTVISTASSQQEGSRAFCVEFAHSSHGFPSTV